MEARRRVDPQYRPRVIAPATPSYAGVLARFEYGKGIPKTNNIATVLFSFHISLLKSVNLQIKNDLCLHKDQQYCKNKENNCRQSA